MTPKRQRRLFLIIVLVAVFSIVTALVLYALRQNISLFYTPTQIALGEAPENRLIRIGGMVVPGSIRRRHQDLTVFFKITDYQKTVTVEYKGILPDLFREGQGIVALGQLKDALHVKASQVLAKHDENYMPPEVKAALAIAKKQRERQT